jgi:hypothetical protein
MSQRSTGSQFDRKQVEGRGEQRRQVNEQSNAAGGQQGETGGSMDENIDPKGLENEVNQGLAQQGGGSANRAGNANESGSMGSTRRDDAPRKAQR